MTVSREPPPARSTTPVAPSGLPGIEGLITLAVGVTLAAALYFARAVLERNFRVVRAQFLDFLRSLPEKQVGADGGAEHRDNGRDVFVAPRQMRPYGARGQCRPRNLHREAR
ncbi:hypothetical protein P3T23_007117 [Paraburkholderia sp. GAS448]